MVHCILDTGKSTTFSGHIRDIAGMYDPRVFEGGGIFKGTNIQEYNCTFIMLTNISRAIDRFDMIAHYHNGCVP